MLRRYMVAIAGVPGSGKSTAAAEVSRRLNERREGTAQPDGCTAPCAIAVPMDGEHDCRTIQAWRRSSLQRMRCDGHLLMVYSLGPCHQHPRSRSKPDCWPTHCDPCGPGFHYYRRELDAMPDAESLHARRGSHWTFNAHAFVAAMHRVGRFILKLMTLELIVHQLHAYLQEHFGR
jgi:hypothetical protein